MTWSGNCPCCGCQVRKTVTRIFWAVVRVSPGAKYFTMMCPACERPLKVPVDLSDAFVLLVNPN